MGRQVVSWNPLHVDTHGPIRPYDAGADSETRPPKPCAARLGHGVWCQRVDGHGGECSSTVAPTYGPVEERAELWRRHRGQKQQCEEPIGDGVWCRGEKGHGGPHG